MSRPTRTCQAKLRETQRGAGAQEMLQASGQGPPPTTLTSRPDRVPRKDRQIHLGQMGAPRSHCRVKCMTGRATLEPGSSSHCLDR